MSKGRVEKCYIFSHQSNLNGASKMDEGLRRYSHRHHDGLLSAVSIGVFFVLVGMLFISIPNLFDSLTNFVNHWHTVQIGTMNINVPVPENLGDHIDVYMAARDFSLVWGLFLAVLLATRFIFDSPTRRKAENVGNIVFWLGATYLIQTFLVETTQALTIDNRKWFEFWAAVIALIGVSLIARAIFLALAKAARSD